ncbi:MAG: hypothetical protein IKW57_01525 [Alphaproteobacteria bacterium]|nr:hypothetical protein [Alphaproteobacteria bacterium]
MLKTSLIALFSVVGLMSTMVDNSALGAVAKTSKQSAIQKGTTVRTKTTAKGLYDQDCYDAYYGCMDQFCISDNESGGSCACSDLHAGYEKKFAEIQDILAEADRIATEEVEKVQAGAQADIIFTGTRQYDEDGNLVDVDDISKENAKDKKRADLLALWDTNMAEDDEDVFGGAFVDFSSLTGAALYNAAEELCLEQVPEGCEKDISLLRNMYSRQITSDCKGFENSLNSKKAEADAALAQANADVRAALKESFDAANKYDLGQCMVEFKKCMQTKDACGENWENCVSTIASENMQNNQAKSTAGTKVATVDTYDITASTMEVLSAKRTICESVLGQCMAVRDMVWPAFLREAAPTIKVAESAAESKFRQSCLTNISSCIQRACKDDIAGKGVDSMDACLSRPDMARSFCKVEIDPCERMEPLIWGYVVDKLAAMRVDACTQEVKDCFTADTRCGENFQNCIGMDYDYIHDICPIDSLVVCKANNPAFSMDDLDSMLMGLYLNIDNSALDQCQELVDRKMAEICGSTTDCNKFAADDTIGTGSLRAQKDGNVYRVTGMISFGSIKMGSALGKTHDQGQDSSVVLGPGEIGVQEYLAQVRERNANVPNADAIITTIEEELNNIAGTINRTIEMIESDPEIQFCVSGRDLSQITGKANQKTTARFPNLLNQVKMQIAISALRQAQDNYNAKFNAAVADATKDASADVAQYMCHKMAEMSATTLKSPTVDLAPPYAISYEIGSGLVAEDLTAGGHSVRDLAKTSFKNAGYMGNSSADLNSGSKETTAVFNRDARICHVCTTTITQNCKTKGSKSWFHNSRNVECTTNEPVEKCEDIQM